VPMTGSYAATLPRYLMPAKDRKECRPALVGMRLALRHVKVGWKGGRRVEKADRRHLLRTRTCSTMCTHSVRGRVLGYAVEL
jgi:hypothetical protein